MRRRARRLPYSSCNCFVPQRFSFRKGCQTINIGLLPGMNLTSISKYAVKLAYLQAGASAASNVGERMVVPTAIMLAGFGLGLSSFSVKKLSVSRSRRSSLFRMI